MREKDAGFYQTLRTRLQGWAASKEGKESRWVDTILMLPDFFYLMSKLMADSRVPTNSKVILAAAIAYVVSPVDFIPEVLLGPIGYLDDIAIVAFALDRILSRQVDPTILQEHWPGESDVLETLQTVIAAADKMIGSGLVRRIKAWVNNYDRNHPA